MGYVGTALLLSSGSPPSSRIIPSLVLHNFTNELGWKLNFMTAVLRMSIGLHGRYFKSCCHGAHRPDFVLTLDANQMTRLRPLEAALLS